MKLSDATRAAIELERKGYDVYMSAAERTKNKLGSETLKAIAAKEIDHIKAIEEFVKAMNDKSPDYARAIETIHQKDRKDYVRTIIDGLGKKLDAQVKPDSDLEKAYKVAMDLETESYEFYKKLAAESEQPEARKFFEFLMGEETNHFELLQETLQYLNNPDEWFKEKEKWIVEG